MTELFIKFMHAITMPRDEEKGATAVEYGLMVALIAVAIIGAVTFLAGGLKGLFSSIGNAL
jgi:pilus assembly protein Flp/PilA